MKRLFSVLLLCLSLQVSGKHHPLDVVGTPLQQDFKLLYREVFEAETLYVGEWTLSKRLSLEGLGRAKEFLEHDLLTSWQPCEDVIPSPISYLGYQGSGEDHVYISFDCADGSQADLIQSVVLFPRLEKGTYLYIVEIDKSRRPKNDIWED